MAEHSHNTLNLVGQRFNRLVVLRPAGVDPKRRERLWECLCDCGNVVILLGGRLRSGNTGSCGCYKKDRSREACCNPLTRLPDDYKPSPDEIRLGGEIGKVPERGAYIWAACESCGTFRWTTYVCGKKAPKNPLCFSCARKLSKGTKGRGYCDKDGYVIVSLPWDSPFLPMANNRGWILKHRFVMAQHLGHCLTKDECVHHLNGNRKDNRIENLQLMTNQDHVERHLGVPYTERIVALESRIKELESQLEYPVIPQRSFRCLDSAEVWVL